jgi:Leucine-rich repeat (LRR) protein
MYTLSETVFNEWLVGFCVPILIGAGFALLSDEFKEYTGARLCFWLSAIWMYGKVLMWSALSSEGFWTRAVIVFLVCGFVGIGLMQVLRLTAKREQRETQGGALPPQEIPKPIESPTGQDGSRQSLEADKNESADTTNPLGGLAQLGWGVKDAPDVTTFEIANKELPNMEQSAKYFRVLQKPFQLHFQQVSSIAGLHFLVGVNKCIRIEIGASNINSLSELKGMSSLRHLVVGQTPFTDLSDLNIDAVSSLVNLETLVLNMSRVRSIESVRPLRKLSTFNIGGSLVNDLSPIENLRYLKSVDVRDSAVTDLSPLQGASRLEELAIDAKQAPTLTYVPQIKKLTIIAQVPVDMRAVGSLSNLTNLFIWGPPVIDFSPVRGLTKLTNLQASGMMMNRLSGVTGLDAIGGLNLTTLTLGWLQIDSLNFLTGNPTITELNLNAIPINGGVELATMSSLQKLSLVDVPLADISPLLSLPKLRELSLLRTPARADVISLLQRRGVKVTNN